MQLFQRFYIFLILALLFFLMKPSIASCRELKIQEEDFAFLSCGEFDTEELCLFADSTIEIIDDSSQTQQTTCQKDQCEVWARVSKTTQRLYLYLNGEITDTFKVSTGMKGFETPLIERHPSGPMYTKYTSKKFPGGNYEGLGNMPYAVFIRGAYAIHGTTKGNFAYLGRKASHGCIRLHPKSAKIFFDLVKQHGLENVWITVEE